MATVQEKLIELEDLTSAKDFVELPSSKRRIYLKNFYRTELLPLGLAAEDFWRQVDFLWKEVQDVKPAPVRQPVVIENAAEPSEGKRSRLPWILGGVATLAAAVVGFVVYNK